MTKTLKLHIKKNKLTEKELQDQRKRYNEAIKRLYGLKGN